MEKKGCLVSPNGTKTSRIHSYMKMHTCTVVLWWIYMEGARDHRFPSTSCAQYAFWRGQHLFCLGCRGWSWQSVSIHVTGCVSITSFQKALKKHRLRFSGLDSRRMWFGFFFNLHTLFVLSWMFYSCFLLLFLYWLFYVLKMCCCSPSSAKIFKITLL